MRKWVPLLLLVGVTACAKPEPPGADPSAKAGMASPQAPATPDKPAAQISIPLLAYVYSYRLSLPGDRIQQALDRDDQACIAAGPVQCQVMGSKLDREGDGVASAHLELRAVPSFIASFRGAIEGETRTAGGRVEAANVDSEDLSRSIVDTEAQIRAQTTLRDRIEKVLAERPGKLADVMDAEHELAKAQADLDATNSELAVMKTRVATSKLTVDYQATGPLAPSGVLRPLRDATAGAGRNMVGVLSGVVTLASFLLPLGLIGATLAGLALMARAWFKAASRRRTPAAATGG